MTLWWIADGFLFGVVIPAVLVVLASVLRAAVEVRRCAEALADARDRLPRSDGGATEVERTERLLHEASAELQRYATAVRALRAAGPR